jgi:hypothetical protein
MSYILDALRKSEQERHPGVRQQPRVAVHQIAVPWHGGWLLIAGLVLLPPLLVAVIILWQNADNVSTQAPPTVAVAPVSPAPVVAAPPVAPVAPVAESPAPVIRHRESARIDAPVRDLAEQARVPEVAVPKPVAVKPAPKHKAVTAVSPPRAQVKQAVTAETNDAPILQQMSEEFQRTLPPMAVTIHVYSPQESQRILFINNRETHKGSMIDGGVQVEEIVSDGVVLNYQGQRFKLLRPR